MYISRYAKQLQNWGPTSQDSKITLHAKVAFELVQTNFIILGELKLLCRNFKFCDTEENS